MGCFYSTETIDFDTIQPRVLHIRAGAASYSGTTERGHCQTLGDAEVALTEDCLYSQTKGMGCCGDHGLLRIPILAIKDIRQQSYFNGRYRADYPHMVISYILSDSKVKHEYQAGWQMSPLTFDQWKQAIEELRARYPPADRV